MPLVLTQSDFRANLTKYLDQVSDDEVIYIIRSNSRLVAFLSQDKLYWMKKALQSKEDSLEYVIARDQLIQRHELPENSIVESTNDYWKKFK